MDQLSITIAVQRLSFEIALLHVESEIFNSDRLLLTLGGFVQLFAQIHHSMDGNYNGLVDLFQDTLTRHSGSSGNSGCSGVAVTTKTTQTAAVHDSFMRLGVNLAKTPMHHEKFSQSRGRAKPIANFLLSVVLFIIVLFFRFFVPFVLSFVLLWFVVSVTNPRNVLLFLNFAL